MLNYYDQTNLNIITINHQQNYIIIYGYIISIVRKQIKMLIELISNKSFYCKLTIVLLFLQFHRYITRIWGIFHPFYNAFE